MANPNPNESKLPAAQQARRERIAAEEAAKSGAVVEPVVPPQNNEPSAPPQNNEPSAPPQNAPQNNEPVNPPNTPQGPTRISDAEIAEMRARQEAAENKARLLELELAEARSSGSQGLTEPPAAPKGSGEAPAPGAPSDRVLGVDAGDTGLSEEETEAYGEAEGVIAKVAKREIATLLNPVLARLEARLAQIEGGVRTVETRNAVNEEQSFVSKVKGAVTNFDNLVRHAKWQEFMETRVPLTNIKFKDSLAQAHGKRELDNVVEIFEEFKRRHQIDTAAPAAGYGSIDTSNTGSSAEATPAKPAEGKLPFSARRQASEDFMKGRITRSELDVIKEKYRVAEQNGNIDYDN